MKFAAAAGAVAGGAAIAASQDARAGSEEGESGSGHSGSSATPKARFIVEAHCHGGASPGIMEMGESVNSAAEWGALRTKDPVGFANAMAEPQVDNTDQLIATMDEKGVTHAILQTVPGMGATNKRISDMARKSKGRFFPIYRPEWFMGAVGAGKMGQSPDNAVYARNAELFIDDVENMFPELGLIGVGEVTPGGLITGSANPVEIARDFGPVLEALGKQGFPIMIPTGYTGWQGSLGYIWDPIWVDEVAAQHPNVPMILAKMGRGFRTSFDTCMVVALRNANVYLEMTDAPSKHIREAVEKVGAHRIMFGSDLSAVSTNYSLDHGFRDLNGANLTPEQVEWICWRTANEVYELGLEA
jgi:predicted TIM-barrel fold metal-dependent hydrolase